MRIRACISAVKILPLVLACAALASCAAQSASDFSDDEVSLRAEADLRADAAKWTRELEPSRLSENISTMGGTREGMELSPAAAALSNGRSEAVYPFLEGFGSLDTRLLEGDTRAALDGFCAALFSGESVDSFFSPDSPFEKSFFMEDLETEWNAAFGEPLPQASADEPLFSSALYGEPFIDENGSEVPARFSRDGKSIDALFFFSSDGSERKITRALVEGIQDEIE